MRAILMFELCIEMRRSHKCKTIFSEETNFNQDKKPSQKQK